MRLTNREQEVINKATELVARNRHVYSCYAIRVAGQMLNYSDINTMMLVDEYADFFGKDRGTWTDDSGVQFLTGYEEQQQRLLMLTMFKELYGKVKL